MKISVSIVAALFLCTAAFAQSQSPEAGAWGDAVEGVQLRLAITAQLATPQVPEFEIQLRNRGAEALTYVAEAVNSRADIEIDGVWYGTAGGGSCCTNPQTVASGSQSNALQLRLQNRILFELDAKGAPGNKRFWALTPGRHSIRLRTRSADRVSITVRSTPPHSIVLLSNVVTFEVLSVQAVAGLPVSADVAKLALDIAKGCVGKSPATFRSVWGSPLNFDKAGMSTGNGTNRVNVFIPENAPRGKPQGIAVDVDTGTGACINFTDRLE